MVGAQLCRAVQQTTWCARAEFPFHSSSDGVRYCGGYRNWRTAERLKAYAGSTAMRVAPASAFVSL
jgi:hypothetical protein